MSDNSHASIVAYARAARRARGQRRRIKRKDAKEGAANANRGLDGRGHTTAAGKCGGRNAAARPPARTARPCAAPWPWPVLPDAPTAVSFAVFSGSFLSVGARGGWAFRMPCPRAIPPAQRSTGLLLRACTLTQGYPHKRTHATRATMRRALPQKLKPVHRHLVVSHPSCSCARTQQPKGSGVQRS